jgi:hypothetical protein
MDKAEYLEEIFALPINMQSVGNVSGFDLYTSDALKEKFIAAINSSKMGHVLKGIDVLVEKGIVVPAFGTKNLLSFIINKKPRFMSHDPEMKSAAFVDADTKKIYFLIENNSNTFGLSDNNKLAETLIHELIHVFCMRSPRTYLKLFLKDLVKYYKYSMDKIMEHNFSEDLCKELVTGLCLKFEVTNREYIMKELYDFYVNTLSKEVVNIGKLKSKVHDMVLAFYYDNVSDNKALLPEFLSVDNVFARAYEFVFNIDIEDKLCLQEVAITSEVISSIASHSWVEGKVNRIIPAMIELYK